MAVDDQGARLFSFGPSRLFGLVMLWTAGSGEELLGGMSEPFLFARGEIPASYDAPYGFDLLFFALIHRLVGWRWTWTSSRLWMVDVGCICSYRTKMLQPEL